MLKWIIGIVAVLAAIAGIAYFSADKDTRNLIANMPTDSNVLFWTIPQRDAAFRALDTISALAESNVIESGDKVHPLPKGEPIKIGADVDAYMKNQRTAGSDHHSRWQGAAGKIRPGF